VVTTRLSAVVPVEREDVIDSKALAGNEAAPIGRRRVHFSGFSAPLDALVYERATLRIGQLLVGPAIVEQMDCTTVIRPGSEAKVDPFGNLFITPALGT